MRKKPNKEIRESIREVGAQWEIADVMGIHEVTLIRLLRHPLDEKNTERVFEAIKTLAAQNASIE